MAEPLFLSFETATRFGSVAVMRGAEVLSKWRGDGAAASHSAQLLPNLAECLQSAGISLGALAFLGVAVGPGSFTGLRVGLATAQGLADTLNLPLVGVETLEAVALTAGPAGRVSALLPSGRNEVFAQLFTVDGRGAVALDALCHARPALLFEHMQEFNDLTWAGEGSDFLHADALRQFAAERKLNWRVASHDAPLAVSVALIALNLWRGGHTENDLTRALYVRGADTNTKPTTA
jgi:tRNA threonylcarbamoyladenosine biosynthesis protein TsaB